jgi:hypothetical protein
MTKSKVNISAAIALSVLLLPLNADGQSVHAQASEPCPPSTHESPPVDPPTRLAIKYIGNAESHKFHRPSCPFARIMALNKRVEFNYRSQAVACGHVPCRYCLPPVWTVVRGRLLAPDKTAEPKSESSAGLPCSPHQETLRDPPVEVAPHPP